MDPFGSVLGCTILAQRSFWCALVHGLRVDRLLCFSSCARVAENVCRGERVNVYVNDGGLVAIVIARNDLEDALQDLEHVHVVDVIDVEALP